jgi:hypothetical protein
MTGITLATEDELSEEVGRVLAAEAHLDIDQCLHREGSGYLRSRIHSFCEMAPHQPVLVIADLDRQNCRSQLLAQWLGARRKPTQLLIRVAVREIEAWLLADHQAMRALLGAGANRLPRAPDQLADPKRTLLMLAQKASRRVREDLLPARGALAGQGLGYNARLCALVRSMWSPARAAELSPSLRRARERLSGLAKRM